MNVKIITETSVTRPSVTPLSSSVLDHATVKDLASFGLRNNAGLWPSYNCLDLLIPTEACPSPLADADFKDFSYAGWQPAFDFAVYGGVQCGTVGLDRNDQFAEVKRVFEASEGKGVEQALLATRFVASGSDEDGTWSAPTDVTPTGTDIPLAAALGLLEGYAAATYAGVPTIHMPRSVAVMLGERIVWEGGKAYTRSGAKVAIGGGYDSSVTPTPATGKFDMYATGEVYVERSDRVEIQTLVLPGDGSGVGSGENGLSDNTSIALVERMYRVAVDCFVSKVTGKAW